MSKFSIKQQLITLLIVSAIAMLTISSMGMKGMFHITRDLKSVYEDRVIPMEQLKDVSDAYSVALRATARKVDNGKLSWQDGQAQVEQDVMSAKAQWDAYLKTQLTQDESRLVNELKPMLLVTDGMVSHFVSILQAQDKQALRRFREEEMGNATDPMFDKIEELIVLQRNVAKSEYDQAVTASDANKQTFGVIVVLGLGISLLLGYFILNRMNVVLGQYDR